MHKIETQLSPVFLCKSLKNKLEGALGTRLHVSMYLFLKLLTSSVSTWKTLSAFFYNIWISITLEVVGYVAIWEAAIEEVWSWSNQS